MAELSLQVSLFDDKIPVDKNFSFSTLVLAGQTTFKIDLEKTFEEKPEHIMDVFNFLNKRYYDSPLFNQPFTQMDYCAFLGKSIDKFRHENVVKADKHERWNNYIERLLYKMLERNIIRKGTYEVPSNTVKKKIEIHEKISLLNNYVKVSHEDLRDKRTVEYIADLSDPIKDNVSTFLFYTTMSDYRTIVNNYYRNPNFRFLYLRLANVLNNLKAGIQDTVSFDELVFILGYEAKENRHLHQQVELNVRKMLKLDSLKGLQFEMRSNANGYKYVPHFELGYAHGENLLTEKRQDKYKRLDLLVLNKLRKNLPAFSKDGKISFLDARFSLQKTMDLAQVFEDCYRSVMKKSPSMEQLRLFVEHYVYVDDYKNAYASNIVKHLVVNGQPLSKDSHYNKPHVTFL